VTIHWLPPAIKRFKDLHPGIEFELRNGDYPSCIRWAEEGQVDFSISVPPEPGRLEVLPVKKDLLLPVLPKNHPLCAESVVSLARFAEEPFILPGEGLRYGVGAIFNRAGIRPNIKFSSSSDYTTIAMVESELGVSILP